MKVIIAGAVPEGASCRSAPVGVNTTSEMRIDQRELLFAGIKFLDLRPQAVVSTR